MNEAGAVIVGGQDFEGGYFAPQTKRTKGFGDEKSCAHGELHDFAR